MKITFLNRIGFALGILGTTLLAKQMPTVELGAYGEFLGYREINGVNGSVITLVPELKFHFSPDVRFDLETGLGYDKDGDSNSNHEIDIEEAALTIDLNENWTTRIGKMHLPVGVYNLYHEPIYFHSVFPSEVEQKIIPNEWHENGAFLSNKTEYGTFAAGIYGGLSQKRMSGSEWIRGTSLEGRMEKPGAYAGVLRYDYGDIDEGTLIGGSVYHSGMSGIESVGKSKVTLWELHARHMFTSGFELDILYAHGSATKTRELSNVLNEAIGKESRGWYVNGAYDVAPWIKGKKQFTLPLFVRYETFDTQAKIAEGLHADPSNDKSVTTVGINYRPFPNVVLNADYQFRDNKGGGESNRFEIGAGFVY